MLIIPQPIKNRERNASMLTILKIVRSSDPTWTTNNSSAHNSYYISNMQSQSLNIWNFRKLVIRL